MGEEKEFLELHLLCYRCVRGGGRTQGGKLFMYLPACLTEPCDVEMINKLNVSFLSFQMTLKDERARGLSATLHEKVSQSVACAPPLDPILTAEDIICGKGAMLEEQMRIAFFLNFLLFSPHPQIAAVIFRISLSSISRRGQRRI